MNLEFEKSDRVVLQLLRQHGRMSVQGLGAALGVTATAIRQRLERLVAGGLVDREEVAKAGRGRPSYAYLLTTAGERALGHNMAELAKVLWDEVQSIADPAIREAFLARVSSRLAGRYGETLAGPSTASGPLSARMEELARALRKNHFVASVEPATRGELPVLKINGCPYPELSQVGHEICEVETKMLSEMAGAELQLTQCRCDSPDGVCTFAFASSSESAATASEQPA